MANVLDKLFDTEEVEDQLTGTIRVLQPEKFLECYTAAEMLKHNEIVLTNIDGLANEYKQRYLDFISGVVMAINGKIRKIDRNIVLCVPPKFGLAEENKNETE